MNRNNGTHASAVISFLIVCLFVSAAHAQQSTDVIFKALQDEQQRNMSQLVMENLEKPYFISYTVDDYQQLEVSASLGTLTVSKLERGRYLTVDARVGTNSLDNSNFVSGFSGFGPDFYPLSVDDDYDAIRNQIYLATDEVYKSALETLSKKRAYLQTRVMTDRPDDHISLPANQFIDKPEQFDIQRPFFEDLARSASEVFRNYPAIISSELKVTASAVNQYLLNSSGSKTLRGDRIYGFDLAMNGKSPDGSDVTDADRLVFTAMSAISAKQELIDWAKKNAEKMTRFIGGDTLEDYIGPVILMEEAAGEFFRQLFAKNISNLPSPLYENDQVSSMMGGAEFGGKLNRRVLPASFTVYDDPGLNKLGNTPVIGKLEVDDNGVIPKKTMLVENGKLSNLLIADAPTKKIKETNGHGRGAVSKAVTAKPTNLVFESSEKVSFAKLKETLLGLCKDSDLDYGLIIRKLRDYSAPFSGFSFFGQRAGGDAALSVPFEIYKLYADGHEAPVRGMQFNNVTARILKDILQTDDRQFVYNYLIGNDYEMPASIVAPSVLIEEMELKKQEEKLKKPPLLPSPLAGK